MYQTQQTCKETILEIRIGPKEKTTHFKVYVYVIRMGPYIEGPIWGTCSKCTSSFEISISYPFSHSHSTI